MHDALEIGLWTLLAGLAMAAGAAVACIERLRPQWLENEFRHGVVAFGGGVLMAAVALVLVPDGAAAVPMWTALGCLMAGGVAFWGLDVFLARHQTPAAQLAAMLSDFLPESLALGAAFTHHRNTGLLLALLIGLQNLPEGFNAFRELKASGRMRAGRIVASFAAMALLGPAAGLGGYYFLSDSPQIVAAVMLFAAGGILYLEFQDIAPQARLQRHWGPPLGAVLGFAFGLACHLITGG